MNVSLIDSSDQIPMTQLDSGGWKRIDHIIEFNNLSIVFFSGQFECCQSVFFTSFFNVKLSGIRLLVVKPFVRNAEKGQTHFENIGVWTMFGHLSTLHRKEKGSFLLHSFNILGL